MDTEKMNTYESPLTEEIKIHVERNFAESNPDIGDQCIIDD